MSGVCTPLTPRSGADTETRPLDPKVRGPATVALEAECFSPALGSAFREPVNEGSGHE